MNTQQPKPESKKYPDLISEIEKGIIKIPKFQRDFVWSIEKTAQLLDSLLKGYPIGTFILWQTDERINGIKTIGNLDLPETPEGIQVQYVLDGQQRITSLYAAYFGAKIKKSGEKKVTDYTQIYVDLDKDASENSDQIVTSEKPEGNYITLSDVLNFKNKFIEIKNNYSDENLEKVYSYSTAFSSYDFSTVLLRKQDLDSAIEVFTRINTGGQTLTLFEIMSAKTYDESNKFDMQAKWNKFLSELEDIKYESISSSLILNLLSLIISTTKECKRKTILNLNKQEIIDTWDDAISSLEESINYFRTIYRIPVSQLLPYDVLLVPFAYFFYYKKDKPKSDQRKYLEELFWRISLSARYSSATESKLAQDIRRIDLILKKERPDYSEMKVDLDSPQDLVNANFRAGSSYCKAFLCLLAYQEPKDFQDNGRVILSNSWLKVASSRNYHHFFPRAYLKDKKLRNSKSLMNIALVSDRSNKRKIGAKAPSVYINDFSDENSEIGDTLASHFINLDGFGIESDDYEVFLEERSKLIFKELKKRIELEHTEPLDVELEELILGGESDSVEFKSTLRYDTRNGERNKKIEYAVCKAIAAFLNTQGGNLIIGVDDDQNILGLENDFSILGKPGIDGFGLKLIEIIKQYIGAAYSSHLRITFPVYNGKSICLIRVSKSSKPVFIKFETEEDFFIRVGCSSQPLSREDQSKYENIHWQ